MAPTKGNYTCKVCSKVSVGAGAHHSHQRRCVAKQLKRDVTPQENDSHPRSESQYRVQSVATGLPPVTMMAAHTSDGAEGPEHVVTDPIVCFETIDENYRRILSKGAEIVCIQRNMEPETVFRHIPFEDASAIDTLLADLVQGEMLLLDEDEMRLPEVTAATSSRMIEQSTYMASQEDSLGRRIQKVTDEGLVMGGVPREGEDVCRELRVDAKSRGLNCNSTTERVPKDQNMKKKRSSRPSEVEGLDVKTKGSAEKLARDLVEIIKGLPGDTRPEDIFAGVKERFRDAGTHLYPIICGIVYSRSKSEISIGVQTEVKEDAEVDESYAVARAETATDTVYNEYKGKIDEPSKRGWMDEKEKSSRPATLEGEDLEGMSTSGEWDVIGADHEITSDIDEIPTPNFEEEYEITME